MKKINDPKTLAQLLDEVIEGSMRSAKARRAADERQRQEATAGAVRNAIGAFGGGKEKVTTEDAEAAPEGNVAPPTPSKTMDDDEQKLSSGEIQSTDIVAKLNAIRSGKSFKDSAIESSMSQYIDSLSKAERTALMSFLSSIAKIVTGMISANDVSQPDAPPADVKMQKDGVSGEKPAGEKNKKIVTIKPNVIRRSSNKKSAEDTTAPSATPIQPKKKA